VKLRHEGADVDVYRTAHVPLHEVETNVAVRSEEPMGAEPSTVPKRGAGAPRLGRFAGRDEVLALNGFDIGLQHGGISLEIRASFQCLDRHVGLAHEDERHHG